MPEPRTTTLSVDGAEISLRVVDSSDAMQDAGVLVQEICAHTRWIKIVRERFYADNPVRADRLAQMAVTLVAAAEAQGIAAEIAGRIAESLAPVWDALLPAVSADDAPEVPSRAVWQRLARVEGMRHAAVAELLPLLVVDPAPATSAAPGPVSEAAPGLVSEAAPGPVSEAAPAPEPSPSPAESADTDRAIRALVAICRDDDTLETVLNSIMG